jgi:hypothetical protein
MFYRIVYCTLSITLICGAAFAEDDTHAGRAVTYSSKASTNASGSTAHSIAASGQVTSAASAIPLSVVGVAAGSTGAVSAQSANQSMKAADAPIGTPLPITDEAIAIIPPDQALKTRADAKTDQKPETKKPE